jgi:hypothetical protein
LKIENGECIGALRTSMRDTRYFAIEVGSMKYEVGSNEKLKIEN